MPECKSEWLIFSMKIEFLDIRIQSKCVCQQMFVFVFRSETNAVRKNFKRIFKFVSKILISDC